MWRIISRITGLRRPCRYDGQIHGLFFLAAIKNLLVFGSNHNAHNAWGLLAYVGCVWPTYFVLTSPKQDFVKATAMCERAGIRASGLAHSGTPLLCSWSRTGCSAGDVLRLAPPGCPARAGKADRCTRACYSDQVCRIFATTSLTAADGFMSAVSIVRSYFKGLMQSTASPAKPKGAALSPCFAVLASVSPR